MSGRCVSKKAGHYNILKYGTQVFHGTFVQPLQRRRRGLWTSLALLKWVAAKLRDRRDDEQMGSPYDANFNVAQIGAVNMGEIGAVRKRCR